MPNRTGLGVSRLVNRHGVKELCCNIECQEVNRLRAVQLLQTASDILSLSQFFLYMLITIPSNII